MEVLGLEQVEVQLEFQALEVSGPERTPSCGLSGSWTLIMKTTVKELLISKTSH